MRGLGVGSAKIERDEGEVRGEGKGALSVSVGMEIKQAVKLQFHRSLAGTIYYLSHQGRPILIKLHPQPEPQVP